MYPAAITLVAETVPAVPEPEGLTRLRREYESKARRLEEQLLGLDAASWRMDRFYDGTFGHLAGGAYGGLAADRAQDRSHAPLPYETEDEWRLHITLARDLLTRVDLAIGFRDHVRNFIGPIKVAFVRRGQAPGAVASGPADADGNGVPDGDALVGAVTQAWEECCELNDWGQGQIDREAECLNRHLTEGECTLQLFRGGPDTDGLPVFRHVEPELIRTPPGHTLVDPFGWGVETPEHDCERFLRLHVCYPDDPGAEGRYIEPGRYVRSKANVDRSIKRGVSDFFPVGENLRKLAGMRANMAHVGRLQAAIAWWEQYPNATEEQVRRVIEQNRDYSAVRFAPGAPGASTGANARRADTRTYDPGTVISTEQGRVVEVGPTSQPAGFVQLDGLVLRGIGFRFGTPNYFTSEGGTFAGDLVAGSQFVTCIEDRQKERRGFSQALAVRFIALCEESGRLPRGTGRAVRAVATARPVVMADKEKQARTFLSLYEKNCADPIKFVREQGDDPKVLAANILAWQKKFPPPDQPPPNGPPAPTDPSATPPGSAGGDGSSPNPTDVFGEHIGRTHEGQDWVSEALYALLSTEARTGLTLTTITDKNGNQVKRWVRQGTVTGADDHTKRAIDPGAAAGTALDKALSDPSSLTAADVSALADHVKGLRKEQLRQLNAAFRKKIGGTKAELADRLLEHLRSAKGDANGRSGSADGEPPGAGGPVAGAAGGPGTAIADPGRLGGGQPAGAPTADRVPAEAADVHRRIDRYEAALRAKGQHQAADWMAQLRTHVNEVGPEAALAALGADAGPGDGKGTQYQGAWDMPAFTRAYLDRHGITVTGDLGSGGFTPLDPNQRAVSSVAKSRGAETRRRKADFFPANPKLKNKLDEAKSLPGLETSEDIDTIAGYPVTHLTPDVTAKLDAKYGPGKWVVKAYGSEAAAGYGIFFPQRAERIAQDARATLWAAGDEVAKHGFELHRNEAGTVTGLKHTGGAVYDFGTPEYEATIHGHVREWGDRAAAAAGSERGAELPDGGYEFMAQPAFAAAGVSDADRAAGKTIAPGEGRVHIVTRDGRASVVPHATWIKGQPLPVVFEDEGTRAMAQAAVDAINALPESERKGQIYAPDIIKTDTGYRVVEANPGNKTGSSGYLSDNPFIVDSYVSHLTGREPAHVQFIRKILTRKGGK